MEGLCLVYSNVSMTGKCHNTINISGKVSQQNIAYDDDQFTSHISGFNVLAHGIWHLDRLC